MTAPVVQSIHGHFTDLANGSCSDSQRKYTLSKLQHFNQYIHFHIKFYLVMNSDRQRKDTENCSQGGSNPQIQTSYLPNANLEHYQNINISGRKLNEQTYKCVSFIYLFAYLYIYSYLTVLSVSQDSTVFKSRTINE
jgi:hypothetical protein